MDDNIKTIDLSKITRITLIDKEGRYHESWFNKGDLKLLLQDDDKTLKLFIGKHRFEEIKEPLRVNKLHCDDIEKIYEIILQNISNGKPTTISELSDLKDDLIFDYLDLVYMIIECEDYFKIKIPDTLANNVSTPKDLIELIDKIV